MTSYLSSIFSNYISWPITELSKKAYVPVVTELSRGAYVPFATEICMAVQLSKITKSYLSVSQETAKVCSAWAPLNNRDPIKMYKVMIFPYQYCYALEKDEINTKCIWSALKTISIYGVAAYFFAGPGIIAVAGLSGLRITHLVYESNKNSNPA